MCQAGAGATFWPRQRQGSAGKAPERASQSQFGGLLLWGEQGQSGPSDNTSLAAQLLPQPELMNKHWKFQSTFADLCSK